MGSHILALRKSEPTLEDVFVELVGRGFGDEEPSHEADRPTDDDGPAYLPPTPSADEAEEADRVEAAPMSAEPAPSIFASARGGTDPRTASLWTRRQVIENNARSLVGRAFPRVRGMVREPSWVFFEILLPFLTTSAFVLVYRDPPGARGVRRLRRSSAARWRRSGSTSCG